MPRVTLLITDSCGAPLAENAHVCSSRLNSQTASDRHTDVTGPNLDALMRLKVVIEREALFRSLNPTFVKLPIHTKDSIKLCII